MADGESRVFVVAKRGIHNFYFEHIPRKYFSVAVNVLKQTRLLKNIDFSMLTFTDVAFDQTFSSKRSKAQKKIHLPYAEYIP